MTGGPCRWEAIAGDAAFDEDGIRRRCGRGRRSGEHSAATAEEASHPGHVRDIDEAVDRIGGDVIARRRRRDAKPEVGSQCGNVCDVRERIVVDVGRPGVVSALNESVCPGEIFDGPAEAVAVGVVGGDRPGRQRLRAVRPGGAVVAEIRNPIAVGVAGVAHAGRVVHVCDVLAPQACEAAAPAIGPCGRRINKDYDVTGRRAAQDSEGKRLWRAEGVKLIEVCKVGAQVERESRFVINGND